jgi:FAD/FMN-containing dehydrogenase
VLTTDRLRGIAQIDAGRRRVTVLPGTTIGEFGDPLWDAGLALANQGDIDTQAIAGAVATGTHGSGLALPSFSATLRACRVVDGHGEVVEIDESTPDLLRAAQVSVGMLGVMTSLTLEVASAYRLTERIDHRPFADVLAQWDELVAGHRHFSFFWLPSEGSARLYNLATPPGQAMTDTCYVKLYDEAGDDVADDTTPDRRVDRSYRIYPSDFDANFHELEYFVPLERGREAVEAMRELMLASQPAAIFPMEVRTTAADDAYLSSNYGTATTVISVSGQPGHDYWDYLFAVDRLLGQFGARVHWGKLHYLTRAQLAERYPESERFIAIRRELDPEGIFLNEHLRPLFA